MIYKKGPYTYTTTEVGGKYEIVVHDDLEGIPGRVGIESRRIEVDKKLYTVINKALEAAYVSGRRDMAEIFLDDVFNYRKSQIEDCR